MADGLDELDAALAGIAGSLSGEALQACTDAAAAPILSAAQRLVHVERGDVKNNLGLTSHHTATQATTSVQVADSGPGGVAHEAIFLEYGTSKMAARPFMRPAFEANKSAALAAFTNALNGAIKD